MNAKGKRTTQRGIHKIEFFANIEYIRQLYKDGYVVAKILFEKLQKEKQITMSYESFIKYFNQNIKEPQQTIIPSIQVIDNTQKNPKVLSIGTQKGIAAAISKTEDKDNI